MSKEGESKGLISKFCRHPNAANLLMGLMVLFGFAAIERLNTQFFPTTQSDAISISVQWPGASAEDVEKNLIAAIEPEVRLVEGLKEMRSTAYEGSARIYMEFEPDANIQNALSFVEQAVDSITTFPAEILRPVISISEFFDPVGSILIAGPFSEASLKNYAKQIRDGLLQKGVGKVQFEGMRREEILVEIDSEQMRRFNITPGDISWNIRTNRGDMPSGTLGGNIEKQLRTLGLPKNAADIGDTELYTDKDGNRILVRDVASVRDSFHEKDSVIFSNGERAILLHVRRAKQADSLKTAATVRDYVEEQKNILPPSLRLEIFDMRSDAILDRLGVLMKNGIGGLILVLCVLFLFLNARTAFWVALGIPIATIATFGFMWPLGQTINMLSSFALIMCIGIIVDDAIVVGEHAATLSAKGLNHIQAAEGGAKRMLLPISIAAGTTMAAFLPILLLGGVFGQLVAAIPIVVFCVLCASLIECFFILPGHLSHALSAPPKPRGKIREKFVGAFERLREGKFRRLITICFIKRYNVLALCLAIWIVAMGLLMGGHVGFRFFPAPEGEIIAADIVYAPGTPREETAKGVQLVKQSLEKTALELKGKGKNLIRTSYSNIGAQGDNWASIWVQLTSSEDRKVRTQKFIERWRKNLPHLAGVERVSVREQRFGPPGDDIDIRLERATPKQLKLAAEELKQKLRFYNGVSGIQDGLPYGKNEVLLEVTPAGAALGFRPKRVGAQVRDAYEGSIAMRFPRGDEEVTVRVRHSQSEKQDLAALYLQIPDKSGFIPLLEIVDITEKPGFSRIPRIDGVRSVAVGARVADSENPNGILADLREEFLPALAKKYNLTYSFGGRAEDQRETFSSMLLGTYIALSVIYIMLAWAFGSYTRPFIIMSIIPFGIIGMVFGHFLMGYELTFLSFIGLMGLSGVLVNNSIILVKRIDEIRDKGKSLKYAIVNGVCDRFRPVVLTSVTTVLGLSPLLFETSLQAQFLKPMVITISWGLGCASLIVLFLVPALFSIQNDMGKGM
ncbi:MAG: efflux RND transporter permease subunit, partial [Parvibaculales bacterium]